MIFCGTSLYSTQTVSKIYRVFILKSVCSAYWGKIFFAIADCSAADSFWHDSSGMMSAGTVAGTWLTVRFCRPDTATD